MDIDIIAAFVCSSHIIFSAHFQRIYSTGQHHVSNTNVPSQWLQCNQFLLSFLHFPFFFDNIIAIRCTTAIPYCTKGTEQQNAKRKKKPTVPLSCTTKHCLHKSTRTLVFNLTEGVIFGFKKGECFGVFNVIKFVQTIAVQNLTLHCIIVSVICQP